MSLKSSIKELKDIPQYKWWYEDFLAMRLKELKSGEYRPIARLSSHNKNIALRKARDKSFDKNMLLPKNSLNFLKVLVEYRAREEGSEVEVKNNPSLLDIYKDLALIDWVKL